MAGRRERVPSRARVAVRAADEEAGEQEGGLHRVGSVITADDGTEVTFPFFATTGAEDAPATNSAISGTSGDQKSDLVEPPVVKSRGETLDGSIR